MTTTSNILALPPASGASAVSNDFGWAAIWAVVGAAVAGLFGWLTQRTKSETDHEAAILAEWAKLNKGLADRLSDVERECAQMRKDHAAEIEKIRREHAEEMQQLRAENEVLRRMIAQNSQSSAHLLSDSPVTRPRGDDA